MKLLERVDAIAELRRGAITTYGGPLSDYLHAKDTEQEAADRAAAEQLMREEKQKVDVQIALADVSAMPTPTTRTNAALRG